MALQATVNSFGIQSGTTDTLYAAWHWSDAYASSTEHFEYKWTYTTGDVNKTTKKAIWYEGSTGTTKNKNCTYTIPSNAKTVKFVMRPISKKHKVNKKEVSNWTAKWSTAKKHNVKNPPEVPGTPSLSVDKQTIKAECTGIPSDVDYICFILIKNHKLTSTVGWASVRKADGYASWTKTVSPGSEYEVKCKALKGSVGIGLQSGWSAPSNTVSPVPDAPATIKSIAAMSDTEVEIKWDKVVGATSYDVEYALEKRYFGSSQESKIQSTSSATPDNPNIIHMVIPGLETGEEWFFRLRAVNAAGESGWTDIKSIKLGLKPSMPTTWSSTTRATTGDKVNLYWIHNSQDGSSEETASLKIITNGVTRNITVNNTAPEDEKDNTKVYTLDTSSYADGTVIEWSVKTKGIHKDYSDYSTVRRIEVYASPVLDLDLLDNTMTAADTLIRFPFYINTIATPSSQKIVSLNITIVSNESYETVDQIGDSKWISAGDEIYSQNFKEDLTNYQFTPGMIDLENNIEYTIHATVSMNTGLTATAKVPFTVAWEDEFYDPNLDVGIDPVSLTSSIRPYCKDDTGNLVENVVLSVYRRNYDGTFTELASDIDNLDNTYVTDPHPALDYARYRIVAISKDTGSVSYFDAPGELIGESSIVLTWGEQWKNFDITNEDPMEEPDWVGEILRLPYNVETSESTNQDVSLVEYIGRTNPVSYYGTQMGESGSWSTTIPKDDIDTLFALRKLQKYMGDVYVREPSGVGYWANVKVSFSQKYSDLTIPVSITVTRVEGGV